MFRSVARSAPSPSLDLMVEAAAPPPPASISPDAAAVRNGGPAVEPPRTSGIRRAAHLARAGLLAGVDFGVAATKANLQGLLAGLRPSSGQRLTEAMPVLRPLGRTAATTAELLEATKRMAKSAAAGDAAAKDEAIDAALDRFLRLFAMDALVNGPWAEPGAYHGAITGGAPVPRKWGRLIGQAKNWTTRRPAEDMVDDWQRGMKRWHATTNAILAANANVSELIAAYLAGVAHEVDPESALAEYEVQGEGVWSDSILDLVANFAGLMVGLCVGDDDPALMSRLVNQFAALIPGPPDPFESADMNIDSAKAMKRSYELYSLSLLFASDTLADAEKFEAFRATLPFDEHQLLDAVWILVWDPEVQVEDGQAPRRLTADERLNLQQHVALLAEGNPTWTAMVARAHAFIDDEIRAGNDPWYPADAMLPEPATRANLRKAMGSVDDVLRQRLEPLRHRVGEGDEATATA